MGGYRGDLKQQRFRNKSVYHPPLEPKPGGTVSVPFANQSLVVKALTLKPGSKHLTVPRLK